MGNKGSIIKQLTVGETFDPEMDREKYRELSECDIARVINEINEGYQIEEHHVEICGTKHDNHYEFSTSGMTRSRERYEEITDLRFTASFDNTKGCDVICSHMSVDLFSTFVYKVSTDMHLPDGREKHSESADMWCKINGSTFIEGNCPCIFPGEKGKTALASYMWVYRAMNEGDTMFLHAPLTETMNIRLYHRYPSEVFSDVTLHIRYRSRGEKKN
jgi:hypothetical protein